MLQSYFSVAIYITAVVLLVFSLSINRAKTILALKKSYKMFLSVLPHFIAVLLLIGFVLALVSPEAVRKMIGTESGLVGIVASALIGAIALVPALIAFPVAAELLKNGAGLVPVSLFISTLTTVGIVTIPIEIKYFGKKIAILRNACFFGASFFTATIIKLVMA